MTSESLAREAFLEALVYDDPVQLYERAPCGFLSTTPDGVIVKCNGTFRTWIGLEAGDIVGKLSFVDLLTPGGRIYHETHYAPSLKMHDSVREIALDLVRSDGRRLPVLVNATLDRDIDGRPRVIRIAVFDATERRRYERELLRAKEAAESSEERAHSLARTLQQTLIPPTPPTIPLLDVAAAYRPAGDGVEVGGDFYDVFPAGHEDWVVVIGDVCGKGVDAAVVTALVRHTVRALAVGHDEPSRILEGLNEVLLQHETDRFCTVALMRLRRDSDGWYAVLGTGGHPSPLLVRGDAAPEPCGGGGPLIGIFDHPSFAETTLRLLPGDLLLLYTDGVPEGRRDSDLYGDERLLATISRHRGSAADLVGGLVADVLDFQRQDPRDDIAVLAIGVPHA
ncbi:MAG: rsbP 3 [Nocardioides sp.]|jgi:sigma-B regulation protein RsbU (phosphoserine phosphatase)|nr:rsbP 3 [Nocardioides sp.]